MIIGLYQQWRLLSDLAQLAYDHKVYPLEKMFDSMRDLWSMSVYPLCMRCQSQERSGIFFCADCLGEIKK